MSWGCHPKPPSVNSHSIWFTNVKSHITSFQNKGAFIAKKVWSKPWIHWSFHILIQLVGASLLEKWDSLITMQLKHQLDNDTIKNKEAILIVFIDIKQPLDDSLDSIGRVHGWKDQGVEVVVAWLTITSSESGICMFFAWPENSDSHERKLLLDEE